VFMRCHARVLNVRLPVSPPTRIIDMDETCGINGCEHDRHRDMEMCYWHWKSMSGEALVDNKRQKQLDKIQEMLETLIINQRF